MIARTPSILSLSRLSIAHICTTRALFVEGLYSNNSIHITYSTRVPVPSLELGYLTPSSASECVSPLDPKGRSNTRLREKGVGGLIPTTEQKAWHSVHTVAELVSTNRRRLFVTPSGWNQVRRQDKKRGPL
jgi:hypothetical protein